MTMGVRGRWTVAENGLYVLKLKDRPGWRNWQTQRAQNPPRFTPRGGSTPPPGTIAQRLSVVSNLTADDADNADQASISMRHKPEMNLLHQRQATAFG
jgi:hypothetical protein